MTDNIQKYFKDINKYPLLTKEEEENYLLRAKFGERLAKDMLVKSNLRFVITVAKKFANSPDILEDLIQEGNIGLIKSIDRFDPTKGVKFLSYAVWWIKQSILAFLNENSRTVRLSLNRIRDNNKYMKEKEALSNELQTDNVLPEDHSYNEMINVHLDDSYEDMSIIEVIPNPDAISPDEALIVSSIKEEVYTMLETIPERECTILKMYYGLERERPLTLDEIGEYFSLTRERVRQIKELTLNRLSLKPRFRNIIRYL